MERISGAFRRAVATGKMIPSTNVAAWAPLVAGQLGSEESFVSTNGAGGQRIVVYDPGLNIGGVTRQSLPFRQGSNGVAAVSHPRLVIVSCLEPGWPSVPLTTEDGFNSLWNRRDRALPGQWPAGWPRDPADLFVQRVDLSDLFHEVTLNTVDGYVAAPYAFVGNHLGGANSTNTIAVGGSPVSTHLLHDTMLHLHYADGFPQALVLVTEPVSYTFEGGRWNRQAISGINGPAACGALGQYVEQFSTHPGWATTDLGTDPAAVVLGMFDVLWGGADWATAGFDAARDDAWWDTPAALFLYDAGPQLMLCSWDLIDE